MKLSMSMLAWYLREFRPDVSVQDDAMTIEGVRLLFDENMERENRYAYFLRADKVFSDARHADSFLLAHNRSTLLFTHCEINELMNRLLAAFDYYNAWEGRLMEAAFAHFPMQQILDIGAEVMDNPCAAGSLERTLWARSQKEGEETDPYWEYATENHTMHPAVYTAPYRDAGRNRIAELSERPILVENVFEGGAPVLMSYIKEDDRYIGCLAILQKDPSLTEMNRQLSPVLNRYLAKASEFADPDGPLRPAEGILSDLLTGETISEEKTVKLRAFFPEFPLYCLVIRNVVRTDEISRKTFLSAMKQNPVFYMPLLKDNRIILFAGERVYRNPDVYLSGQDFRNIAAGFSLPLFDIPGLRSGYLQASVALEQGGEEPGVYYCRDFAFSYLLKNLQNNEMTGHLLHPAIGVLRKYDADTGSELLKTLSVYMDCYRNLTKASKMLNVHSNTLKYRLQRIAELTGIDLDDAARARYLQMSLWLSMWG